MVRIVLSGGGTGGHIYPALALYRALKEKHPVEVLYIGTQKGLESTIVPKEGIPFKTIDISGLKRSLSMDNIKVVINLVHSTRKARKMMEAFKPDIVIGTGGYVCGPVLLAASSLKIPTIIHEQNSIAGITNKFLARFVDKIAICFNEARHSFGRFQDKIILTGNPRGQEVLNVTPSPTIIADQFGLQVDQATVLIFGGSRGAPAINQAGLEALEKWRKADYQVIIATGQNHFNQLESSLVEQINLSKNVRIVPYIDNMPEVMRHLDLVICRAGATTLTEITAIGLPSILVPSPYVTNNHQEHNALALVRHQAASWIKEKDLTAEILYQEVDHLMQRPDILAQMRLAASQQGIPNASNRLIDLIEELLS